jgi:small subunit ribosomal protein S8
MVTDPIADMLTRVRNAAGARHRRVDMPVSKVKVEIARLLKENHYIHDYKLLDDEKHGVLRLYLKYYQEKSVIRELRRVSKPGLRKYVGVQEIPRVRNGLGLAILSTSRGVMSGTQARENKVGGELLAIVW